ncbi:hypothetical protein [Streptomyces sp. NPDC101206]|uniref:hypothetical protein n=1 Tax=Streptomyces sp. NPDC101206 TaxID=3366128 RepID=UPI00382EE796
MPDQPAPLPFSLADLDAETGYYPSQIGVYCDDCCLTVVHDYVVHTDMTRDERLGVARKHLTDNEGWDCGAAGDLCPGCKGDEPGMCPACDTPEIERCASCGSCRCDTHENCTNPSA